MAVAIAEACIASDARFYWLAQGDPQNYQMDVQNIATPVVVNVATIAGTLKAMGAQHIAVVNVPDYCMSEVADHTLALLLAAVVAGLAGGIFVFSRHPGPSAAGFGETGSTTASLSSPAPAALPPAPAAPSPRASAGPPPAAPPPPRPPRSRRPRSRWRRWRRRPRVPHRRSGAEAASRWGATHGTSCPRGSGTPCARAPGGGRSRRWSSGSPSGRRSREAWAGSPDP